LDREETKECGGLMHNIEFTQEEVSTLTALISEVFEEAAENGEVVDSRLETAYGKLMHSEAI
jgi:hypothetical protein